MSITRSRKEETLAGLTGELGRAGSIILADFTGIDVAGMTRLRNQMRAASVGFKVVKNTILRKAFAASLDMEAPAGAAAGPTAVAWHADEVLPVRILKKFARENNNRPVIKGGLVAGQVLSAEDVLRLADLPGRDELLARIAGSMNSPIQGFVNVTGAVLRSFLNAVNAVREQRESSN